MATNQSSPDAAQPVTECPKKRLFVCCDGTWKDAVNTAAPLTNVARLARCVKAVSFKNGTQILQIVHYQTGIGRGSSTIGRVIDGATGRGISTNIRDAYSFLCHNFNKDKDEIHLVGFSRGAYTVCCLARLIKDIGILTKSGLTYFPVLFKRWKAVVHEKNSKEKFQELDSLHSYVGELERALLTSRGIRIKSIGIWDSVSALGIPIPLQFPQPADNAFRSIRAVIPDNVDHCYHALALDEIRKHFEPVIWEPGRATESSRGFHPPLYLMKQCWFLGEHGDVGGGNIDSALLSDTSLIWMIAHLTTAGADFDNQTLYDLLEPKKLLLENAAQTTDQDSPSSANSTATYQNDYEVDSPRLLRRHSHTRTSANAPKEKISGGLSSQSSTKISFQRAPRKFAWELLRRLMGTRRRKPGKEIGCGQLIHWSARLHLRGGHYSPALKDWTMVRAFQEQDFLMLAEDAMSRVEKELIQDLLNLNKAPVNKEQADQKDPRGGKFLQFFEENNEEILRPRRLYVEPRIKPQVMEMDEDITRHHRELTAAAARTE
ncbi:uncharacterized protein F4812DRAFT_43286 [Daldinia caldariorum]|uniref:uncharacterized protein n=1 Tax=Daldinia caldariorum TaxID=326644 RepID=UPI002008836D|nr:uncharacterized protein F4812DRAFT_43286 [Daldinia caldariorum]KAI1473233.1 hypothetical protein F4812DRAFT_43286 [Daldinia caldariorum]